MKKIKLYALSLLATVAMFGCSKYDDTELRNDVNDLKSRVEKLETWCNTANGQISALQGLVTALEQKDFITGVTSIMEGAKEVGYTITFTKSNPITILHGKDGVKGLNGVTPIIGVKQHTDGFYYWTIKIGDAAETWMTDPTGNKIRTTGDKGADGEDGVPGEDGKPGTDGTDGNDGNDGHSPVLSVDTFEGKLYWKIDGEWLLYSGNKVPATGDTGDKGDKGDTGNKGDKGDTGPNGSNGKDGDSIFAKDGIDTTDPDNVTFTLADGTTKITLPRTNGVTVGFESYDVFYCSPTDNEITLVLPSTLKESDYNTIIATVSNSNGTNMDIQTRSASNGDKWGVRVTKPTFSSGNIVEGSAKVTLTLPQDKTNYKAMLRVTIVDSKGKESSVTRVVWFKADEDVNVIDNTSGALADKVLNPATVKQLSVIGPLSNEDFAYMRQNLTSMEVLDLSRSTLTLLPVRAMAFYSSMGLSVNTSLKTVILPETLTEIGNSAFAMCTNLQEINLPSSVTTLGRWMFEGCEKLASIEIPSSVREIPASAFYGATGLETITIPASVTTLGEWAFEGCSNLSSVHIKAQVSVIPGSIFHNCKKLTDIELPSTVTKIEENAFAQTGFTQVTIPDNVTTIGAGAFSYCSNLESVTLHGNLTMSYSLFAYCPKLKNVTIPEGVTEIGAETFRECRSLQDVVLPSTVKIIRDRAFQNCSSLSTLTCKATTVPVLAEHNTGEIENFHFYEISAGCVLKRPNGADYSAWNQYFQGGILDLQ